MWFRTIYSISGVYRARGDALEMTVDGYRVVIWHGPHPRDISQEGLFVQAVSEEDPPEAVATYLAETASAAGDGEAGPPDDVREFSATVSRSAGAAAVRAVELFRWRTGASSPYRPYASLGSEWSSDGEDWRRLPTRHSAELSAPAGFRLTAEVAALVDELAQRGDNEPIAHQLLREALDVYGKNKRSAVVIGVAAVESGFKHLVADLVPDAAWLVESVPSPPTVKMLRDYLPRLPARATFDGVVHAPPKYVRTLLVNAVEERNAGLGS